VVAFLGYLPRGESLSESEFKTRHTFLQWVLALQLPGLLAFGLFRGFSLNDCLEAIAATVREALALRPGCPLIRMDARDPESCLVTLIGVVEHALARSTAA
jgi:hypothetical protein